MPGSHNQHGCMPEVLGLITEMTLFYDKYHLLQREARAAFNTDLRDLHHRLSRTGVVLERDVGSVSRRIKHMHDHFNAWMENPVNREKTWNLHPSDDFDLFVSKGKIVLARMEHEILTHRIAGGGGGSNKGENKSEN